MISSISGVISAAASFPCAFRSVSRRTHSLREDFCYERYKTLASTYVRSVGKKETLSVAMGTNHNNQEYISSRKVRGKESCVFLLLKVPRHKGLRIIMLPRPRNDKSQGHDRESFRRRFRSETCTSSSDSSEVEVRHLPRDSATRQLPSQKKEVEAKKAQ